MQANNQSNNNTNNNQDLFHYLVGDFHKPIDLYVQFKFAEDLVHFERNNDKDQIWITIDWIVLDWFKNFAKKMIDNQVQDSQVVKGMALAFIDELLPAPIDVPSHPVHHNDSFHFLVDQQGQPINLYVEFEYMENGFFERDDEEDEVLFTYDWVVMDWFKHFNYHMGIQQPSDEELVKNMALTMLDEF